MAGVGCAGQPVEAARGAQIPAAAAVDGARVALDARARGALVHANPPIGVPQDHAKPPTVTDLGVCAEEQAGDIGLDPRGVTIVRERSPVTRPDGALPGLQGLGPDSPG